MRQATTILEFETSRQGLVEITREVIAWVADQQLSEGLLTLCCRHTSASLLIQENAAPDVRADLEAYIARIAPEDPSAYAHDDEGPDDMPAHLRTALTQVQLSIPLLDGRLALGTWQGIYLFEHRRRPHRRSIALHLAGNWERAAAVGGRPTFHSTVPSNRALVVLIAHQSPSPAEGACPAARDRPGFGWWERWCSLRRPPIPKPKSKPKAAPAPKPKRPTKSAAVISLLRRDEGATLAELVEATGWLPHTTRAALTGLKKKGHVIDKSKRDDATCYRILEA